MRQTDGLVFSRYSRQRQIDRTAENQVLTYLPSLAMRGKKAHNAVGTPSLHVALA